jgi:hypothetical protein
VQESVPWTELLPHLVKVFAQVDPSLSLLPSMPTKADIEAAPRWKLLDYLSRYKTSDLKHWFEQIRAELSSRYGYDNDDDVCQRTNNSLSPHTISKQLECRSASLALHSMHKQTICKHCASYCAIQAAWYILHDSERFCRGLVH